MWVISAFPIYYGRRSKNYVTVNIVCQFVIVLYSPNQYLNTSLSRRSNSFLATTSPDVLQLQLHSHSGFKSYSRFSVQSMTARLPRANMVLLILLQKQQEKISQFKFFHDKNVIRFVFIIVQLGVNEYFCLFLYAKCKKEVHIVVRNTPQSSMHPI